MELKLKIELTESKSLERVLHAIFEAQREEFASKLKRFSAELSDIKQLLGKIIDKENLIIMNQQEAVAKIEELTGKITSVGEQIRAALAGLREQVSALQEQVAAGADLSQVATALQALDEKVTEADALVDDLPTPEPIAPIEPAPVVDGESEGSVNQ